MPFLFLMIGGTYLIVKSYSSLFYHTHKKNSERYDINECPLLK
jgi:hypothetical protein